MIPQLVNGPNGSLNCGSPPPSSQLLDNTCSLHQLQSAPQRQRWNDTKNRSKMSSHRRARHLCRPAAHACALGTSINNLVMVTVLIMLVSLMEMIVATSPHPAVTSASAAKCSETENNCMNGGTCRNGTCICADGWQGDECQFCGGKVR